MINKNIKIYFVDLDGTLYNCKKGSHEYPSSMNLEIIKKEIKKGIKIIPSTGRLGKNLIPLYDLFPFEYCISGCGAIITDGKGNIIKEYLMQINDQLKIIDFAQKHQLYYRINDEDDVYGVKNFIKRLIIKKLGYNPIWTSNYSKQNKKIIKIILVGKMRKKIKELKEIAKKSFPHLSVVSSMNGLTIEFTHKNANKGYANKFVYEQLGFQKFQVAHIGDSMNDVSTKEVVAQLIILDNARADVKNEATHIGIHYKLDGVGNVLKGNYYKK